MATTRNQVYNAFFALLKTATFAEPVNGCTTWAKATQRLQLWNAVDQASQQPYMALIQHKEIYKQQANNLPPIRTMPFGIWIYAPAGDPDSGISGGQLLNTIRDALDAVMIRDNAITGTLTLGGLVTRCFIEGEVFCDPGDIDGQAMLILIANALLP